jgi:hypothetical protein
MTSLKPGGSGIEGVKFEDVGDHVHGVITRIEDMQQTTMDTPPVPKTWPDGNPVMQTVVTLETSEGLRRVFLKGAKSNPQSAMGSVVAAIERSGAEDAEVGGTLDIEYVGNGERKAGKVAPKLYHAAYAAPEDDE